MREHLALSTPPEWTIETIGSLAKTLSAGGTPSRANPAFWNGTNPFVLIEDITGCGLYLDSTRGTISDEGLTASSAWLVPAGAVLVSMYATIGATTVTRIVAATNQAIAAIIPREGVQAEFLAFSIRHYRDALSARNVQSTQKNINKGILESFEIPVPPLDEQRKIAAVLGKVQAAVAVEGDLVRVARELKQAALRQLFTRGLRHEPQKQTAIGPVPESWDVVPVSECVTPFRFDRKQQVPAAAYSETGRFPIVDQGKQAIAGYCDDETKVITPRPALIVFGDHTRCVKFVDFPFVLGSDGTKPLVANPEWDARTLFYALSSVDVESHGYNRHYKYLSEKLVARSPDPAEQREIAALLATLDAKIAHHEARQALLRELFRTLLHDLLTARRRVTSLDLADHFADFSKLVSATP